MSRFPTLRLAWRYVAHHRLRSAILATSVALVLLLPLTVRRLVASFERGLASRAAETPLVLGAPGSRYDLVLATLYFQGRVPRSTRRAMRWVITRVLPLPAPARTRRGPSPCSTAARCAGLRPTIGAQRCSPLPRGLQVSPVDPRWIPGIRVAYDPAPR